MRFEGGKSWPRGEHPELEQILIRGFFHTLGEVDPLPDTIIFFNFHCSARLAARR